MGGGCEPALDLPSGQILDLRSRPNIPLVVTSDPLLWAPTAHWAVLPRLLPASLLLFVPELGSDICSWGVHCPSFRRAPPGRVSCLLAPSTACMPGHLPCLTGATLSPAQSPGGGEQVAIDPSESGKCHGDGHDPRKIAQQLLPEGLSEHRREAVHEAGWGQGRAGDRVGPHSPRPLR